jgi:glycogen operon protein
MAASGSGLPDVWWVRPDGRRMTQRDWHAGGAVLGVFLNGRELPDHTPDGRQLQDDSFLVIFNASDEDVRFVLPPRRLGLHWTLELSTADPDAAGVPYVARAEVSVASRSLLVLRRV